MADVEDVGEKSMDDVLELLESAGVEDTGGQPAGGDESGQEFIDRMREAGNTLISNNFGNPIVEIITTEDNRDGVGDVIAGWNTNPTGPDAFPQDPSFADERPDVAEDLVSFQFLLQDREDLDTAGYDLERIIEELENEPILITQSPSVQDSIPV